MARDEPRSREPCLPSSVTEAARSQLRRCLKKVVRALRQIKRRGPSAEAVHDLRVWSRRTTTAMEFFAPVLPRKKRRRIERTMHKLRKAAGEVRDCDVLLAAFPQQGGASELQRLARRFQRARRRAAKPLLRQAKKQLERARLKRRNKKLLDRIRWRSRSGKGSEPAFAPWGRERLQPLLKEFLDAARGDLSDDDALHTCRLAAKRLRYAADLVGSACPELTAAAAYQQLEQLQDRLGRVRDHRANADRLASEAEEAKKSDQPLMERAVAHQQRALQREKRRFLRWWTPARQRTLLNAWNRLIAERDRRRNRR